MVIFSRKTVPLNRRSAYNGITLVELLISTMLMGFLALFFVNVFVKGNAVSVSSSVRLQSAAEVQALVQDLQQDLRQGAYISNNSHSKRLEYTTYDSNGNPSKKIYRITTISGNQYLQLSEDNGTSWMSPYHLSRYDKYILTGTPKFLYAWAINNCTDFNDTNLNGIWTTGVDAAGAYQACPNGTSSPVLSLPSQASKIVLNGFVFTTAVGNSEKTRTLPSNIFIAVPNGPVRSTSVPSSPAVKDVVLLHQFDTATANSTFGTAFGIRTAAWEPARERLFLVGQHSSGNNKFFFADRRGVSLNNPLNTFLTTIQADGATFGLNGNSVYVLDGTAKVIYQFNTIKTGLLKAVKELKLGSPTNLINSPKGIAFDPTTPSDIYIAGTDPADSAIKIFERNYVTGALVGSAWTLPAAFDSTHPPSGLTIEPISGDFLVVRNYVNGVAPNQTIDIYRINRVNGTSTSFSVNISDLGSSATGTTGNWGIAYDAILNRLFLSDSATNKVYEIQPSIMITSRS